MGWKAGDLAVCVRSRPCKQAPVWMFWRKTVAIDGPALNDVLAVVDTTVMPDYLSGKDEVFLQFEEWPLLWFASYGFRKVQRRDLSAWLETAAPSPETDHIDKSRKAPVKERV